MIFFLRPIKPVYVGRLDRKPTTKVVIYLNTFMNKCKISLEIDSQIIYMYQQQKFTFRQLH